MKTLQLILIISALISIYSCKRNSTTNKEKETFTIEHFNICIVPDLSNRIDNKKNPKPVKDAEIVNQIIKDIYPNILKNRIDTDQPDKIQMVFTNPRIINYYNINNIVLKFDFGAFDKQSERITYLLDRDNNGKFKKDKNNFNNEFAKTIEKAREKTCGADLWSLFNNEVNESFIITKQDTIKDKKYNYIKKYKNLIVLLTDGYIEAGLYGKANCKGNKSYFLSSKSINNFRNKFKASGETNINAFFEKNGYGIVPVNNPILKDVEVMAVEFYDRSLTQSGNATVHPTDGEILELFWNDWMEKSGVKKFKSFKIASTPEEFLKSFHGFAGIRARGN